MKYCIDIGHNFPPIDTGAVGILKEDEVNLAVGTSLINKLNIAGDHVTSSLNYLKALNGIKTRTQELQARCDAANKAGVDLFVSIHCNSVTDKTAQGVEVWYYSQNGYEMALKVCAQMAKLGYRNRGPKKVGVDGSNLYVISNTKAVAVLVECFFISNSNDVNLYNPAKISSAIYTAITGRTDNVSAVGITSKQIKDIQQTINAMGIKDMYKNSLVVDGQAGPKTIYCVKVLYDLMIQLWGAR
jgi:N-acetylmuramoyl-L-alanine amidase